jgi:hypothetical protein
MLGILSGDRVQVFFGFFFIVELSQASLTDVKFWYTDKKENQIFLIYKEIQSGAVAKSYIVYEEGLPNIRGNAQIFPHI